MSRKFVSLSLLFLLVVMLLSGVVLYIMPHGRGLQALLLRPLFPGVVLYIMPHGRVAYWRGWSFLGFDKDQWDNLHTVCGFLMVLLGIWHLVVNWRSIVRYAKGNFLSLSKDFWFSLLFVFVVFSGTTANLPPFSFVPELGEKAKRMWKSPESMPPVPHAELLPLAKVAKFLGLAPAEALNALRAEGIEVYSPKERLKEIAVKNKTTPARIYRILSKDRKSHIFSPGIGRLTLRQVCLILGVSTAECLERLRRCGVSACADDTLKAVAGRCGKTPREVLGILRR